MLPPHRFYYLHNFVRALDWIATRSADLLRPPERDFIAQFRALPQPAQALLVRMLMRRGPWFRASRLVYEEIPDLAEAAAPLLHLGWLADDAPMALDELFALHTLPELRRMFPDAPPAPGQRKGEWLVVLQASHAEPKPHAAWHPAGGEAVWRVTVGELCERLRLMFFGNLHQGWAEFVLADLGIFQYETVTLGADSRAFRHPGDVDAYLAIHAARQAVDAMQDTAEADAIVQSLAASLDACAGDNPWLARRRDKALFRLGQACERRHDWPTALRAYEAGSHPEARHRRMRVLEHLGRLDDALALAEQASHTPIDEAERQRVARMLLRLRRQLGLPPDALAVSRPTVQKTNVNRLILPNPLDGTSVEVLVRAHWHEPAAPVFYVENTLLNSLFGLLCWPAIFAPLPGAFFHPFQSGPADLGAPDFATRRQAEFARCLALLDSPAYADAIRQRHADKRGLQSPFVHWGVLNDALLDLALACMPAAHLKAIFTRLLQDVARNRSGLPDLVRFWPDERRYELVEVKGPGDKLQDNQVRWMAFFQAQGIPASLCHVAWADEPACTPAMPAASPMPPLAWD